MSCEHRDLWCILDQLDQRLADQNSPEIQQLNCQILKAELDQHVSQKEPILFDRIEEVLTAEQRTQLCLRLENTVLPSDWVCPDPLTN